MARRPNSMRKNSKVAKVQTKPKKVQTKPKNKQKKVTPKGRVMYA